MDKKHKLIILGDSAFAEIAYEYFSYDSEYEVVAFAVEKTYSKRESLFGIPIIAVEDMSTTHSPDQHFFFAANVYTQRNKLRTRFYTETKAKGYKPASYISPALLSGATAKLANTALFWKIISSSPLSKSVMM